ncbi:hypothetical protein CALCODRAFT_508440 [Calocera cornea HHB12733]|uniref:Uncharacterized protein n=1 Tax=Calocera cornea HHB12733 TaxID=1353952 RepID=A0A165GFS5_9BASI|nr:hypothetical protein CALCODRAFT_508440 [Calocera cornea HHB12733]
MSSFEPDKMISAGSNAVDVVMATVCGGTSVPLPRDNPAASTDEVYHPAEVESSHQLPSPTKYQGDPAIGHADAMDVDSVVTEPYVATEQKPTELHNTSTDADHGPDFATNAAPRGVTVDSTNAHTSGGLAPNAISAPAVATENNEGVADSMTPSPISPPPTPEKGGPQGPPASQRDAVLVSARVQPRARTSLDVPQPLTPPRTPRYRQPSLNSEHSTVLSVISEFTPRHGNTMSSDVTELTDISEQPGHVDVGLQKSDIDMVHDSPTQLPTDSQTLLPPPSDGDLGSMKVPGSNAPSLHSVVPAVVVSNEDGEAVIHHEPVVRPEVRAASAAPTPTIGHRSFASAMRAHAREAGIDSGVYHDRPHSYSEAIQNRTNELLNSGIIYSGPPIYIPSANAGEDMPHAIPRHPARSYNEALMSKYTQAQEGGLEFRRPRYIGSGPYSAGYFTQEDQERHRLAEAEEWAQMKAAAEEEGARNGHRKALPFKRRWECERNEKLNLASKRAGKRTATTSTSPAPTSTDSSSKRSFGFLRKRRTDASEGKTAVGR